MSEPAKSTLQVLAQLGISGSQVKIMYERSHAQHEHVVSLLSLAHDHIDRAALYISMRAAIDGMKESDPALETLYLAMKEGFEVGQ